MLVGKKENIKEAFAVIIGGGFGTLARFFICLYYGIKPFPYFPYTVLSINLVGTFLAGAFYALLKDKLSRFYKAMLFIGFFGAFTTFSEFSFDTNTFILNRCFDQALLNIGYSLFGGLAVFGLGYYISLKITSKFRS